MRARLSVVFLTALLAVLAVTVGLSGAVGAAAGGQPAELVALDASSGTQRWTATPGDIGLLVVGEDRGVVVVAGTSSCRSGTGTLTGLDARTGSRRWQAEIASPRSGPLEAVVGAGVAVARKSAGSFEAIDVKT